MLRFRAWCWLFNNHICLSLMMSQRCLKLLKLEAARVFFFLGFSSVLTFMILLQLTALMEETLKHRLITMDHLILRVRVIGGEVGLTTGQRPSDGLTWQGARMILSMPQFQYSAYLKKLRVRFEENHVGCLTINLRKIYQKNMLNVTFWLHKDVNMGCVLCHEIICLDNVCG